MRGREHREAERVPILGELHGEMMVYQPLLVRDISRAGASVETRYPLQIESLHDLRLTLAKQSIVLKARVVHSHLSEVDQDTVVYRSGLEFIEPPAMAIAAIVEFLETLKANRSGV